MISKKESMKTSYVFRDSQGRMISEGKNMNNNNMKKSSMTKAKPAMKASMSKSGMTKSVMTKPSMTKSKSPMAKMLALVRLCNYFADV